MSLDALVPPTTSPLAAIANDVPPAPTADPEVVRQQAYQAAFAATPPDPDNYLASIDQATADYENLITQYGDKVTREEAAARAQQADLQAVINMHSLGEQYDPTGELRASSAAIAQQMVQESIDRRREYALEQQIIQRAQDLAAAGNDTEARIVLNIMEHGSVMDEMVDIQTKAMIIDRELERAQIERDQQPWYRHAVDFVAGLTTFWQGRGGNFDLPASSQHWYDWLFAGQRVRAEVAGLYNLPAPEFAQAVRDQIIPSIRDNSGFFGYQNNSQYLNILSQYRQTTPAWQINVLNAVDIATLIPFGRAFKVGEALLANGARTAYTEAVAAAWAKTAANGTAATAASGMTLEELTSRMVPTAVRSGPSGISLLSSPVGPINDLIDQAQALVRKFAPDGLQTGGRLTAEEAARAAQAVETEARQSVGRMIQDVNVERVPLANGDYVSRLVFYVGRKDGRGFMSRETALGYAESVGLRDAEIVDRGTRSVETTIDIDGARQIVQTGEEQSVKDALRKALREGRTVEVTSNGVTHRIVKVLRNGLQAEDGTIFGASNPVQELNIIRDTTGQYFLRVAKDIPETGFFGTIAPKAKTWASRMLLGARSVSDARLADAAQIANDKLAKMLGGLVRDMQRDFTTLRGQEKLSVEAVLGRQATEGRWLAQDEAEILWDRAFGRQMTEREWKALQTHRQLNDLEWIIRNDDIYKTKVLSGVQTVEFDFGSGTYKTNARIRELPKTYPLRAFDVVERKHILHLNSETMEALKNKGYVLVETEDLVEMPRGRNGTITLKTFVGHPEAFRARNLERTQLGYRAGGHRIYDPIRMSHFARQTRVGVQADTGKKFLMNPATYMGGTKAEVDFWTSRMEAARQALKEGATESELDEILGGQAGLPTGKEFMEGMKDGTWKLDKPFVTTEDRVMPQEYYDKEADNRFVDMEEGGFNGWLRTTGRLYTGRKGAHLQDWLGREAPVLDSWQTINQSLMNVAQIGSFSDYKIEAVERWVKTFSEYVVDLGPDATPFRIFLEGSVKPHVPGEVRQALEAQRDIIKRNLAWNSEIDLVARQEARRFQDWVLGDTPGTFRHEKGKDLLSWWKIRNPVQAARGLAFDMKLGLFNPAQFPLQIGTMAAALTLSPKNALKAMQTGLFVRLGLVAEDRVPYNLLHQLGGFRTEEEARAYIRHIRSSGFFDLNQHNMMEVMGPHSAMGLTGKTVSDIRSAGRFFFNEAERWNRIVAYRIAWEEGIEKLGTKSIGSDEFNRFVAGRREDYSFQMSRTSQARWQTGLLSVPTQFWGYNARMLEAIFGKTFTPAQRLRLALGQLFLYGTSGTAVTAGLTTLYTSLAHPRPNPNQEGPSWTRGMVDNMIYAMTGQDLNVGQRLSTGGWLPEVVKSFFGASSYGPVTPADFTLGATASILGPLGTRLLDAARYAAIESGTSNMPMTLRALQGAAMQVSTFSNAAKALMVMQYGEFISSRGTVLADDIPREEAFAVMLGFAPGEVDRLYAMKDYRRNRSKVISEMAEVVKNYRRRLANEPDRTADIESELNAYVKLIPEDIRRDVMRRAHQGTEDSVYDQIAARIERETNEEYDALRMSDNGQTD